MNATECSTIQRLVSDLDDTRVLYAKLEPLLIRPHLTYLVERITQSHDAIADDLAAQMERTGGVTARRGRHTWSKARAWLESWLAVTHVDVEVGCLKHIARHETRIIQRFHCALNEVKGLHQNLHRELRQLERALCRIESLMQELETPAFSAGRSQTPSVVPISIHERTGHGR